MKEIFANLWKSIVRSDSNPGYPIPQFVKPRGHDAHLTNERWHELFNNQPVLTGRKNGNEQEYWKIVRVWIPQDQPWFFHVHHDEASYYRSCWGEMLLAACVIDHLERFSVINALQMQVVVGGSSRFGDVHHTELTVVSNTRMSNEVYDFDLKKSLHPTHWHSFVSIGTAPVTQHDYLECMRHPIGMPRW